MSRLHDLFHQIEEHMAQQLDLTEMETRIWEQHGEICAPFILDSAGFTRATQSEGIVHYLSGILRMRKIVSPLLNEFGCINLRCEADNIFAEFPHPDQAFLAAKAAIKAVDIAEIPLQGKELYKVGVGIGYGRVLRSSHEGVFGDEMNLASKLGEDIGEAQAILLTAKAYTDLDEQYKTGFEVQQIRISKVDMTYYQLYLTNSTIEGGVDHE